MEWQPPRNCQFYRSKPDSDQSWFDSSHDQTAFAQPFPAPLGMTANIDPADDGPARIPVNVFFKRMLVPIVQPFKQMSVLYSLMHREDSKMARLRGICDRTVGCPERTRTELTL